MWGVFVRTVLVWHITWSVNSVTHVWGYRNYDTDDDSRNNWWSACSPTAKAGTTTTTPIRARPRHGHRWWEFDVTWLTIRFLERIGLATHVVPPSAHLKAQAANARLVTRGSDGVPVD